MPYPHPCVFVPHPCGPVPFLCLSKEKEPKERTPRRRRLPLRGRFVGVGRGSPTMHPCIAANARDPSRPFGPGRPPSTGAEGDPGAKSGALLSAEAKASRLNSLQQDVASHSRAAEPRCLARAGARVLLAPSGSLSAAASVRRIGPQGRREGSRRVRRDAGCIVGEPRSALAQSRAHDARATDAVRVPFSLVTFSWASKRKLPARRDAGRTRRDAGRSSGNKPSLPGRFSRTRLHAGRETDEHHPHPSLPLKGRAERSARTRAQRFMPTSPARERAAHAARVARAANPTTARNTDRSPASCTR